MEFFPLDDDVIDVRSLQIIDSSKYEKEILPEPLPSAALVVQHISALVAGQLPDFLKPQRITLHEYAQRRLAFEAFSERKSNPRKNVATFSCLDEVIDEKDGELLPIPLIESHNPGNRIVTLRGEETISFMKEDGVEVMGLPFYIHVESMTRKGVKILVATDDSSVALNVHDLFVTFFDKSRTMAECTSYLVHKSVHSDILFIVDRGELFIPQRKSQKY